MLVYSKYVHAVSFLFNGFDNHLALASGVRVSPSKVISVSDDGTRDSNWKPGSWALSPVVNCRILISVDRENVTFVLKEETRRGGGSDATITIILRDANMSVVVELIVPNGSNKVCVERQDLPARDDLLFNDSLYLDVIIQRKIPDLFPMTLPRNPFVVKALKGLKSGNDANVRFVLIFEGIRSFFFAHKYVLWLNAPKLAALVNDDPQSIVIEGVSPPVFGYLLRSIYGEDLPPTDLLGNNAKEIINAAYEFGVERLKKQVEAALVASSDINTSNVVEYIRLADAKGCALLKEFAIALCIVRWEDVVDGSGLEELAQSPALLREVVKAQRAEARNAPNNGNNDYRTMPVFELLKRLLEKELDLDGSREELISRLLESAD